MSNACKTAFTGLGVMGEPRQRGWIWPRSAKSCRAALADARALGLAAPVTALVDQFYADVQAAGGGRMDTSALITRLPRPVPTEG